MTDNSKAVAVKPVDRMKAALSTESVQEQFRNCLKESSSLFVSSLIDIYAADRYLQECAPGAVIMEALKAATLKLPINKSLGFAYIVPYKGVPQMQIGYKGYIQLALRTSQYKYINAGAIYEGQEIERDIITGEVSVSGKPTSRNAKAYFAYIETVNGFKKIICWTKEEMIEHAKKFSKVYDTKNSVWKTNFDAMALKTMLRNLLSKYGVMSVEMMQAMTSDRTEEEMVQEEIDQNANSEAIDIDFREKDNDPEAKDEGGQPGSTGKEGPPATEDPDW